MITHWHLAQPLEDQPPCPAARALLVYVLLNDAMLPAVTELSVLSLRLHACHVMFAQVHLAPAVLEVDQQHVTDILAAIRGVLQPFPSLSAAAERCTQLKCSLLILLTQ